MANNQPVKVTLRGVPELWTNRIAFDCNGTLRANYIDWNSWNEKNWQDHLANPGEYPSPFGKLPDEYGVALVRDLHANGPVYVAWSYETPIAWVDANGTVCVPPVKYSATTSKHLGKLSR